MTQDLQSLGHAAGMYQQSPKLIAIGLKMATAGRALTTGEPMREPESVLRLNGVTYYHADDIADAITALAKHDVEKVRETANEQA